MNKGNRSVLRSLNNFWPNIQPYGIFFWGGGAVLYSNTKHLACSFLDSDIEPTHSRTTPRKIRWKRRSIKQTKNAANSLSDSYPAFFLLIATTSNKKF